MNKITATLALFILLLPLIVAAQGSDVALPNPISCNTLLCVFVNAIKLVLGALGLFGLVMFIWGGVNMMTSAGNPEKVQKAKETLVWATLGLIIILGSWVILRFVLNTVVGVTST
ncbi:MAG: pilin [bacterium]